MVFLDATIDKGFRLNSELLVDGGGEDRHFNLKYKDIKLKQIRVYTVTPLFQHPVYGLAGLASAL